MTASDVPGIVFPCGCILRMSGRTDYCESHRKMSYLCDKCDKPYHQYYDHIPEPGDYLCPECREKNKGDKP